MNFLAPEELLAEKRVLITRPRHLASEFGERLEEFGATAVYFPVIDIYPPDDSSEMDFVISRLNEYDRVVFTSVNGVWYFEKQAREAGIDDDAFNGMVAAAIGPATAEAARDVGFVVDVVPDKFVAEELAEKLGNVKGQNILMPRADIARPALKKILESKGADVHEITAYETKNAEYSITEVSDILHPVPDVITFTSSSTVKAFHKLTLPINPDLSQTLICCIGPITADTARKTGYNPSVVAEDYTIDGMIRALTNYYSHVV